MVSVSAYLDRAIRPSSRPNKAIYLVLVVLAMTFYGCGSGDTDSSGSTATTGSTSSVQPRPQTAVTGAAGTTAETDAASSEESAFTVQIGLADGKFTRGTPRSVAIIEGVPINLEFDVRDEARYPLVIEYPSGEVNKDLVLNTRGDYATQLPALKRDEVLKVSLGEETIEITAGFEPGP